MKNIQIIDGAENCAFSVFSTSDDDFRVIFPAGTDIEFVEDLFARLGTRRVTQVLRTLWERPIEKKLINGIHGTLFFQLRARKRFYPTNKEAEMIAAPASRRG